MGVDSNPILDEEVAREVAEVADSGILSYRSEALPTWCPGCGYYGITMGISLALRDLSIENRNLVVVSGIGCAGRFPFFVKGYGFHVVHGRALPVACGIKIARPELTVVAIGGDGDGLAIGGGHLPHAARRNVDITYILFDNAIYGLTKGQASPTTPLGQVTATTPYGTPDVPLNPTLLAIAHGAPFVARGWAGDFRGGEALVRRAMAHRGFSFLHFVSPCVTFDHVNLTWDRMRDAWRPVPDRHDPTDLAAAMALAIDPVPMHGVFVDRPRPTFHDAADAAAAAAAGSAASAPSGHAAED